MKTKFLLKNWSSVSAAAAMLLGFSNRAAASKPLQNDDTPKIGDGDPYEPLILKPPSAKVIPEERFAQHVSHSSHVSHASHASHASHYSGSYGGGYSTSTSSPSPAASTAPTPPVTRIELADGKIIYGTVYVKSSAGITFKGTDGKMNKLERGQLSSRTITELGLPPEQTPTPASTANSDLADVSALRQKNEELDKSVKTLQSENETLKEEFRVLNAKLASSPPPSAIVSETANAPAKFRVSGVPDANTLNVRGGPGSNFPVVTALWARERGITRLPGRIKNGITTWQQISVNGYQGWVNADYISPEAP